VYTKYTYKYTLVLDRSLAYIAITFKLLHVRVLRWLQHRMALIRIHTFMYSVIIHYTHMYIGSPRRRSLTYVDGPHSQMVISRLYERVDPFELVQAQSA